MSRSSIRARALTAAPRWLPVVGLAVVLIGAWVSLRPVLDSGLFWDDMYNFQIPVELQHTGQGFVSFERKVNEQWIDSAGRFFPGSLLIVHGTPFIVQSIDAYKAATLVAVLVNLVLLWFVVRALAGPAAGLLAAGVVAASVQFRTFYDPVLAFSMQQQVVVACVLASMLLVLLGIDRRQQRWLALASVTWTIGFLTYETVLLLAPVVALAPLARRPLDRAMYLRAGAWLATPSLAMGVLSLILRSRVEDAGTAYTSNFALPAFSRALRIQAEAALPTSYTSIGTLHETALVPPTTELVRSASLPGSIAILLVAIVVAAAVVYLRNVPWRSIFVLAGMGAVLWLVPSAIVAQTVRWQLELVPGAGYVPVYVAYYGVGLLAVAVVSSAARGTALLPQRLAPPALVVLAVAVGATTAGSLNATARANDLVVETLNDTTGVYSARTLSSAVERGLLDDLEDGTTLRAGIGSHWENGCWISHLARADFTIQRRSSHPAMTCGSVVSDEPGASSHVIAHHGYHDGTGWALVAAFTPDASDKERVWISSGRLYAEAERGSLPTRGDDGTLYATCMFRASAAPAPARQRVEVDVSDVTSRRGWLLAQFDVVGGSCAAESLELAPIPRGGDT